jgi:hypothetical protein
MIPAVRVPVAAGTADGLLRRVVLKRVGLEEGELATGPVIVERVTGIEPALSAWEADVLPLNYTRRRRRPYLNPPDSGASGRQPELASRPAGGRVGRPCDILTISGPLVALDLVLEGVGGDRRRGWRADR